MEKKNKYKKIMLALAIVNLIAFFFQPDGLSPFDTPESIIERLKNSGTGSGAAALIMIAAVWILRVFMIVYIPLIIAGTSYMVRSLFNVITGKDDPNCFMAFFTLFSVCLVTYGTFNPNDKHKHSYGRWRSESLVVDYYGGEIYKDDCFLHGDTILYKTEIINNERHVDTIHIDSMVIDKATNTCYWTYSPDMTYEIISDNRAKFEKDLGNKTFEPYEYSDKFQFIINCVNNKKLDQYYDPDGNKPKLKNDSLFLFVLDSYIPYNQYKSDYISTHKQMIGYLLFDVKDSTIMLADSSSNIYKDFDDYGALRFNTSIRKENGSKILLQISRQTSGQKYSEYNDFYDIEKRKFVLNTLVVDEQPSSTQKEITILTEINVLDSFKDGYPILEYKNTFYNQAKSKRDTLEIGQFEMTDGMYEKITKYEFTNGVRNTK